MSDWDDLHFLDQLKKSDFFDDHSGDENYSESQALPVAVLQESQIPPDKNLSPNQRPDQRHGHRDRLRQRFLKGGVDALHDYELLELLLFMAIPRRDIKPIAKNLITRFGSFAEVISSSVKMLQSAGLSENAAIALKTVQVAAIRLGRDEVMNKPVISSWQALLSYIKSVMSRLEREQFRILFLDKKNVLIADEIQNEGTVDQTAVYPREVSKRALELSASAIVLIHNHPSGDPTPSRGDIEITREIIGVLHKLEIKVHDHIVLGRRGHVSFKSQGLL